MKWTWAGLLAPIFFLVACAATPLPAQDAAKAPDFAVEGLPTMINLGTDLCLSCRKMSSVMEELEKEYRGRATIAYIDMVKHREQAAPYKIRSVPTQIFFDKEGKERFRHEGVLSKKRCIKYLEKLGAK